ncbi:GMC oxidoreductase [Microbacterium sp. KUDC0406]|uniref:GMC oxidoreductase n=1 Tax=Microbacterium sp. KUDC0406 TaxID=2909588 RepID=UPI001F490BBB|nr:GMC oxidoreductase [Microbacterium sp. KUDC0406]UJP08893.1 GMC oxidoreductase [Microbacterium sp. KUDC0406]
MTVGEADSVPGNDYDICVVGAGPVGLVLAIEAADAGSRVLLVDAGDAESWKHDIEDAPGQRTHIVDDARHAPLVLTTRRGLGGTSAMWGGRCVAFEPIDFEPRDYVPDSDWPIRIDDVQRWYEPTARHLDAGTAVFRSDRPDLPGLSEFTMSNLERWAQQPKLAGGLGRRAAEHPLIDTLFDARLTDIDFGAGGTVTGLVVRHADATVRLSARAYALAMGGLEITRLLLSIQRRRPELFGGPDGPLGRYYMGHTTGSIADIVLDDPADVAELDFVQDDTGTYIRRRFTLTEEAQRRHRVLNTSFYVDNPPFYEYEHRNATLSAVFLGLAIRPIGRLILAEGIRQRHVGPRPYHVGKHIGNIVRRPFRAAADVIDIFRRRYASRVRKPGFILRNEGGRYAIHYHGEQLPNPESRLMLSVDANGDEVLDVDYRFLEEDVDSLLACHELLDAELRAAGIGRIEYLGEDADAVRRFAWEQTTDGFHSIGTTRMSREPGEGVVDADLRVHGTPNLFIASSSVFPTSAEANPTFFAAVLAARLADHLSGHKGVAAAR